jgi:hypothetical protein
MQFIFFVPPNEELEGTLHPQKLGCTPKNEGKRVHVPPDKKNLWASLLELNVGDNTYTGQNEIIDGFREHFEVLAIPEGGTN